MTTLESITSEIVDCEHKTSPVGDGYAYAIGTKAMKGGRIVLEQCRPVSLDTYEKWARRAIPEPGDLVLAREAPVGEVVRLPEWPRYCLGQRTVLIKPDNDRADGRFLHYWLQGPTAQHSMHSIASGATTPHLNVGDIRALPIESMPRDLAVQKTIGSILGSIDDLIENNRRRIEVLEEMAQAIYREWFVHFRFPGHEDAAFVDSPFGPIPEGWKIGALSQVADVTRSSIIPSKTPDSFFAHYSLPSFDEGQRPVVEPGSEIRSGKFVLADRCVLLSKLNPRIPRVWFIGELPQTTAIASTEFLVLTPVQESSLELIYLTVSETSFLERLHGLTGGTSGSHQRAKPGDVMALQVVIPPLPVAESLVEVSRPSLELARTLNGRNLRLTSMRDLLLPKLVTGEINVSGLEINALIEAAS